MDQVIDSLVLYTVQSGVITSYVDSLTSNLSMCSSNAASVVTVLTVLFVRAVKLSQVFIPYTAFQWFVMPSNLVFLGFHFTISKRVSIYVDYEELLF